MNGQNSKGIDRQHRGLTQKIKIAQKALGLDDGMYRVILQNEFGVMSSKMLGIAEKEKLLRLFESWGWMPQKSRETKESQLINLRERIHGIAREIGLPAKRLRGLCRLMCQVDDPGWTNDKAGLTQLLAVLGKLKREGI